MIKKNFIVILMVISYVILLTACFNNNDNNKQGSKNELTNNQNDEELEESGRNEKIFDYEDFRQLYENMEDNLNIEDYSLIYGSNGEHTVAIGPELTFGKGVFLTLSGDTINDPTQDVLYFESKDMQTLISVSISYTENCIGNDCIYYLPSSGEDAFESELKVLSDFMIISYKNLVITVHQTNKVKVDREITKEFMYKIRDLLLECNA